MLTNKTRVTALIAQLDHLIAKYENTHPDVAKDLRVHRTALQEHLQQGKSTDIAKYALRISVWVKFFIDHWPDI